MTPLNLASNQSVLFVDDHWIARHTYVWRQINQPERVGNAPVLTADQPWEAACVIARAAQYDSQRERFRLWYQTYNPSVASPENMFLCYAESSNGMRWEKPHLGQVLYRGSKDNNIVVGNLGGLETGSGGFDSPNVVEDAGEPDPEKRFKLLLYAWPRGRHGHLIGTSPDGITWQMRQQPVQPKSEIGDAHTLLIDRSLPRPFVSFNRSGDMYDVQHRRCIYRSDSEDFESWSAPQLCLAPDLTDAPRTEYYNMSTLQAGGGLTIGLLQVLHRDACNPNCDWQSVRLAYSRDTQTWKNVEPRDNFFEPGPPGSFDDKWVYLSPPVAKSPTSPLWFFYDGRSTSHGSMMPSGAVGAAVLRREAWCSISSAHEKEALLETVPFLLPEGKLSVNVRNDHGGSLRVEALCLDANETLASRPLLKLQPGASLFTPFDWEKPVPAQWIGKRVVLRFWLRASHLYGFRFMR